MRAYSASSEDALRPRDLLEDWAGECYLTDAQFQSMEKETVCDLRRTNTFLRILLFFFTLLIVGAAIALFFDVVIPRATGVFLLIFAALSYGAAEVCVAKWRLYR